MKITEVKKARKEQNPKHMYPMEGYKKGGRLHNTYILNIMIIIQRLELAANWLEISAQESTVRQIYPICIIIIINW